MGVLTEKYNGTKPCKCLILLHNLWSGRGDLNPRPHAPEACALPGCATPRSMKHYIQKMRFTQDLEN